MKNISLYDYQEQMRQRIREALSEENGSLFRRRRKHVPLWGRSVMVQMPTGTGKTYLMAAVVDDFLSGRVGEEQACVWIIAHRRELVEQVENALIQLGIKSVSAQEVGGKGTVKVMSIQWLSRHYGEMKDRPSLIVVDEAHHALAATYQDLWGRYPEALKLGLTATPCRMQKKGFTTLFDNLLTSWNIDEFIRRGYLALYDYVVINRESEDQLMIDSLEKRGADGDFSVPEMSQKLNSLPAIMRLYHSVEQYAKGKKGIVYAIDISHARRIAEYYAAQGLKAVANDSKTPAAVRKKILADFKPGWYCECESFR
ncbi:MAG: DEAD/DEAH box helicase family protein [Paraprevotella sp.]|nr:DEAD/DEAH box helicase family protein [Paraprevotella sp.]